MQRCSAGLKLLRESPPRVIINIRDCSVRIAASGYPAGWVGAERTALCEEKGPRSCPRQDSELPAGREKSLVLVPNVGGLPHRREHVPAAGFEKKCQKTHFLENAQTAPRAALRLIMYEVSTARNPWSATGACDRSRAPPEQRSLDLFALCVMSSGGLAGCVEHASGTGSHTDRPACHKAWLAVAVEARDAFILKFDRLPLRKSPANTVWAQSPPKKTAHRTGSRQRVARAPYLSGLGRRRAPSARRTGPAATAPCRRALRTGRARRGEADGTAQTPGRARQIVAARLSLSLVAARLSRSRPAGVGQTILIFKYEEDSP